MSDPLLAALQDDLFDEQPGHRQVHRSPRHQSTGALAVEASELFDFLRPVGAQDQVEKGRFSFFQLPAPRCLPQEVLGLANQGIGLAQQRDHIGCPRLAWRPFSDSG